MPAPSHPTAPRIVLLLAWVAASALGGALIPLVGQRNPYVGVLALVLILPLPQYFVVRWWLPRASSWLLTTVLGAGAGAILALAFVFGTLLTMVVLHAISLTVLSGAIYGAGPIAGAVTGWAQARFFFGDRLRRAAPWIVACAIGSTVFTLVLLSSGSLFGLGHFPSGPVRWLIAGLLAGTVHGLVSGMVLLLDLETEQE